MHFPAQKSTKIPFSTHLPAQKWNEKGKKY